MAQFTLNFFLWKMRVTVLIDYLLQIIVSIGSKVINHVKVHELRATYTCKFCFVVVMVLVPEGPRYVATLESLGWKAYL